jgi:hypothetical protein
MGVSQNTIDAVAKMRQLDLSQASEDDVRQALQLINKTPLFTTNFPKGGSVARTRCVADFATSDILYEQNISYNPDSQSVRIGRANLAGQPVFYAVSLVGSAESTVPRTVSYSETSSIAFDKDKEEAEEYAVIGRWSAKEDFKIVWFIHHKQFNQPDPHIDQLRAAYEAMLSKDPLFDDWVYINEALAAEFAKEVPKGQEYGYGFTSVIGKYLLEELGCDAVGFPSVKAEGGGLNLAIHPRVLDSGKMNLEVVLVERVYKFNKDIINAPYLLCNKFQPDGRFIWEAQELLTRFELKQVIASKKAR